MLWVANNGASSGADGMTPFLTFYTVSVQLLFGFLIHFFLKKKINRKLAKGILLIGYGVLYELIFVLISKQFAILRAFESEFSGELFRAYSFSSLIGVIISLIVLRTIRTSND
jgi:hypothetical protein